MNRTRSGGTIILWFLKDGFKNLKSPWIMKLFGRRSKQLLRRRSGKKSRRSGWTVSSKNSAKTSSESPSFLAFLGVLWGFRVFRGYLLGFYWFLLVFMGFYGLSYGFLWFLLVSYWISYTF